MADALEKVDTGTEEEAPKPTPQLNPRNISMKEIAASVAEKHKQEFAETAPVVDDEGVETAAPPATEEPAPAAEEEAPAEETPAPATEAAPAEPAPAAEPGKQAIDPAAEYEIKVDGVPMKVSGQKIIDAGFRTFQKETAADYRLQVATDLLRKAEEQARQLTATPQGAAPAPETQQQQAGPTEAELANAIQYGTPEQAQAAIKMMLARSPSVDPAKLQEAARAEARNQIAFEDGLKFVQSEYADLLKNDYAKRLFITEENRMRAAGDQRPHKALYQEIGEGIRKAFNMPKPAAAQPQSATVVATAQARQERKAAAPSVPRTAAGRLAASEAAPKAKTPSDIIAAMRTARGQGGPTQQMKKG